MAKELINPNRLWLILFQLFIKLVQPFYLHSLLFSHLQGNDLWVCSIQLEPNTSESDGVWAQRKEIEGPCALSDEEKSEKERYPLLMDISICLQRKCCAH